MAEKIGNLSNWEQERAKADKLAEAACDFLAHGGAHLREKLAEAEAEYRRERSRAEPKT